MEELLKLYFSTETIDDYACDECHERCRCDKVSGFRTTPNCLATRIDRQPQYNQLFGKLNRVVTFSETLDLAPFCVEPGSDETYRLYAVVCHLDGAGPLFGRLPRLLRSSGRPRAVVALGRRSARPVGWDAVRRVNPYMLFYARARPRLVFRAAPARPREGSPPVLSFLSASAVERGIGMSSDPDTTRRPSGEMATHLTYDEDTSSQKYSGRRNARSSLECPSSVATHSPVATSHTLSVLSFDPDTTRRPSGNTATPLDLRRSQIITKVQWTPQRTPLECPCSVATHSPVATSHTLSAPLSDAQTRRAARPETRQRS